MKTVSRAVASFTKLLRLLGWQSVRNSSGVIVWCTGENASALEGCRHCAPRGRTESLPGHHEIATFRQQTKRGNLVALNRQFLVFQETNKGFNCGSLAVIHWVMSVTISVGERRGFQLKALLTFVLSET